ncbi:MAG: hypothetical protein WDZ77_01030 [Candidatus Pacearchaeota archaeon]
MISSKKGQVSDTLTWVVATLIIVVVLGISMFFTNTLSNEKEIQIKDKQKDFLAVKSITNFLENEDEPALLSDGSSGTRGNVDNLLEILPTTLPEPGRQFNRDTSFDTKGLNGIFFWSFSKSPTIYENKIFVFGTTYKGITLQFSARCYGSACLR